MQIAVIDTQSPAWTKSAPLDLGSVMAYAGAAFKRLSGNSNGVDAVPISHPSFTL